MSFKNYSNVLRPVSAGFFGCLALLFFIYLCWIAGTDAQGAIGLFFFAPVLALLVFIALKLARNSNQTLRLIQIVVVVPIVLFYLSGLAGVFFKPAGFVRDFVLESLDKSFEEIMGVSSYDWGKGTRRIHVAAGNGDLSAIESEVRNGASVNLENAYKETPLFFCTQANKIEACRKLIELGANVNQQKNSGWTVLQIASDYKLVNMVAMFVEAGADLNIRNYNENTTALGVAKKKGYSEVVNYLEARGAIE